ncbi:hypothetical protein [Neisseria bacilliformis]|nr:hypothetical protein [Neisseria bacilliformis]
MKISTLLIAAAVFGGMYYVKHHVDTSAMNESLLQPQSVQSAQR